MTTFWTRFVRFATVSLALSLVATVAFAMLPDDTVIPPGQTGSDIPTEPCPPTESISVALVPQTPPLVGAEVGFRASPATVVVTRTVHADCQFTMYPLPDHAWQLTEKPTGSVATLEPNAGLSNELVPDLPGRYTVSFIACPQGCAVQHQGSSASLGAKTFEATIEVVENLAIRPEAEPDAPPATGFGNAPIAGENCIYTGGSVVLPAWVTVEPWQGTQDYKLLEGRVKESKVSRKDSPFNHTDHDVNINILPDASLAGLMSPGRKHVEVEWERRSIPEIYRPTRNDRASVRGYWIYDCSHGDRTEIHPPVMTVAHRPRPVRVGENMGLGSDIFVPGIVSHLYISGRGGKATQCAATGLHQPNSWTECVPHFGAQLNSMRILHEFNIYLPRNPQELIAPYKNGPEVRLYLDIDDPTGTGGPPLSVVPDPNQPNVLRASVDLTNYGGWRYARKISAAWALPSADNWGMKRWRLQVNELEVENDADAFPDGDGDWRFWVNTNNVEQEWTKIFDCDDCVHGTETFGGAPFRTGSGAPANRSLGPDIALFPGQKIWLMTTGYESDLFVGDGAGEVAEALPQRATRQRRRSACKPDFPVGCGQYILDFQILEVDAVVPATLTPAGEELADAYTLDASDLATRPWQNPIIYSQDWGLPGDIVVAPGSPPEQRELDDFIDQQGPEPSNLGEYPGGPEDLAEVLAQAEAAHPGHNERFMNDMRATVLEALAGPEADEARAELRLIQPQFPSDLWDQFLGDIDLNEP